MASDKETVFQYFKNEIPAGALSRKDDGSIYIFLKENNVAGEKDNLLIFGSGNKPQKATYHLFENNGTYFVKINSTDYELMLPDKISDEDPFTLTIKSSDGVLIDFENYI
jgi:hypothetical protein